VDGHKPLLKQVALYR